MVIKVVEEEKMGVIIQKLVGAKHGDRFYPDFSGVARSHNFYPKPPMDSSDGVVSVALGLGKTVVEGGICVRFCPKYPRHLWQFGTNEDYLQYSQKTFYALNLKTENGDYDLHHDPELQIYGLEFAEQDGSLASVGSVYSFENDAVYDGLSRKGTRIITFAPVLKHKVFPLPEIVSWLLKLGTWGMGSPVEIEFAVNLGSSRKFSVLQIRPLVVSRELEELDIDNVDPDRVICRSPNVLGVGKVDTVRDIVMVDNRHFKRAESHHAADEIGSYNGRLNAEKRPYLLISLGRIGSADPWLGVPVRWDQISGVRVIIETGFPKFKVVPSQGAHFFQNLTSMRIGYFTVNQHVGEGFLDWDWLHNQMTLNEGKYVKHVRFEKPLTVMMNGHRNQGVILKPE